MKERLYSSPNEIAETTILIGEKKTKNSVINMFVLGILAGAFIAFAAEASNMAAFNLLSNPDTYGLGKFVAGAIFPVGLIMVLVAGSELFTGNNLIIMSVLNKKVKLLEMLKNWFFVYLGNFVGSVLIAYFISESGLFHSGNNTLGAVTIRIASYKVELGFSEALILGIMCNWLVCLAVWMSYGAKDMMGKMFAAFFPIWLFITSGFEHSIANMYYVPAGIFAKGNQAYVVQSQISVEKLANLNWCSFFVNNLIPVTLGNIIGGAGFVGAIYFFLYVKKSKSKTK